MIRLLFALFTVVSAIAVVSSAFLQFCFLFSGRGFHFDSLFLIYLTVSAPM
ncbi:hypothetical protein [Vibrio sp. 1579]|uniref:hypothetical protein n=1 Tax=Vibrio sp. 1579 TaxID=3074566 RepID=UPI002964D14E|nr:hypothetical protein [Vibrio sp. 1579]MDW2066355.1 hypothetical protein [Vibrio sp. 1579]